MTSDPCPCPLTLKACVSSGGSQVARPHAIIRFESLRQSGDDDRPGLQDDAPVGEREGHLGALLDHQHRQALFVQLREGLEDALDHQRGKTHGRLVEQQQTAAGR